MIKTDLKQFAISIPPDTPPDIQANWHLVRLLVEEFDGQIDKTTNKYAWQISLEALTQAIEKNAENIALLFSKLKDYESTQTYWEIVNELLVPSGYGGKIYGDLWKIQGNHMVPTGDSAGSNPRWEVQGDYLVPK